MAQTSKFLTIIRPEFMSFCGDACRAATFNHLLFRIAYRCKDQPRKDIQTGKVLWYGKNEQITEEMSNAWGVCKVRKEINALIDMKLIGKGSNPAWGADRTKHFFFGAKECAIFLQYCEKDNICVVHLDLPPEVKHLIYLSCANDKSIKCLCPEGEKQMINSSEHLIDLSKQTINLSNAQAGANDKSIKAITKNTKNSNKDLNKDNITRGRASHTNVSQKSFFSSEETETQKQGKKEYTLPDLDQPTTLEAILQIAEFYRSGKKELTVSKRSDSLYVRVYEAAEQLLSQERDNGQKGFTLREINAVFCFLKGKAPEGKPWLIDGWWVEKKAPVELHIIAKHIENKLASMEKLESQHAPQQSGAAAPADNNPFQTGNWSNVPTVTGRRRGTYTIDEEQNKRNAERQAQKVKEQVLKEIADGKDFEDFELELMVEEMGIELTPDLQEQYERYQSSKAVLIA